MSTTQTDLLTYVIPTYNRPEFMQRLLHYYAEVGCAHPILIADSSDRPIFQRHVELVSQYQGRLNLQLQHFDMGVIPKCSAVLEAVQTPFTIFTADDDFHVPAAVDKCCRFLAENEDYSTCGGTALFGKASGGPIVRARTYRSLEADCPINRLRKVSLGQYFCLFYAVHRTVKLQQRFALTNKYTNYESSRILPEVLLLQLMALDGKIKLLNDVAYIRQGHDDNDSNRLPNVQSPEVFMEDYRRYEQPLLERFENLDVQTDDARKLTRQSLIDLVPECQALFDTPSSVPGATVGKLQRKLRKLLAFGIAGAGRKFKVAASVVSKKDAAIELALHLLDTHTDQTLDAKAA